MSTEGNTYDVVHQGGNQWLAASQGAVYRVDLDAETPKQMVTGVGQGNEATAETRAAVLQAVASAGPEYREGPQEQLHVTVETPAAGNAGTTGQSDASGGSDDANEKEGGVSQSITLEHDHDLEALAEDVNTWLNAAAGFKGDIRPDWVSVDQAQATIPGEYDDPDAGQRVVGFQLDTAPWFADGWDGENNEWSDGDAEETFGAHREALQGEGGIFRTEDAVLGIKDDEGYYDNFVPADRVEDLG